MKLTRYKEAMLLSIYFEKRACRKLKTLITKPWVSNDGLRTVSTSKARGLCNYNQLVETVSCCHKELHTFNI